jgi:transposase
MNRLERTERIVQICRDIAKNYTTSELARYCSARMNEDIKRSQVWHALDSRGIAFKDPLNAKKRYDLLAAHENNMLTKSWDKDLTIERT